MFITVINILFQSLDSPSRCWHFESLREEGVNWNLQWFTTEGILNLVFIIEFNTGGGFKKEAQPVNTQGVH